MFIEARSNCVTWLSYLLQWFEQSILVIKKLFVKIKVVVAQVVLDLTCDIILGGLDFIDQAFHFCSVDGHLITNSFHLSSVLGHIVSDLYFVVCQNVLDFPDDTNVAVLFLFYSTFIEEVRCQHIAIEFLHLVSWIVWEVFTHVMHEEVILIIQSASLGVSVHNPFFEYIFITLRDVSNQEITKDDEQENDNHNPEGPDERNHDP